MRALLPAVLLVPLALGCRIDLDHGEQVVASCGGGNSTAQVCIDSEAHSDFQWIETKIFATNCSGMSCHASSTASGKLDLSRGNSYAAVMGPTGAGVMSGVDDTRKLVVPGDPAQSYLFFLVHGVPAAEGDPPYSEPPDDVGYMPRNNKPLCCQKIEAIERWIAAGAMND